eukprot:TRINITY_DN9156_c0_g1_i1.p1 TRINITY_DN9156_c0_g1~~TRINITY_DN9156_c0_g1_i1.p1  ORF type:complete len:367 (-),score=75.39 TRINITY_DN9156_c0_g1_i1:31-1131(-)
MVPKNGLVQKKVSECKSEMTRELFSSAIHREEVVIVKNYPTDVPDDYTGPRLEDGEVTEEFISEMIEHFVNEKCIHVNIVYQILLKAKEVLATFNSLVRIDIDRIKKITVCGDVHGQFYDVVNIFNLNGIPSEDNPYLFNGDFVDRGSFSCEVIITFLAFKILYPNHFFLARGNHESMAMNKIYGYWGEIKFKYSDDAYDLSCEVFNLLPLAHVIGNKVLVVHGGLFSQDGVKLEDIESINRNREPPQSGLMSDILWADPQPGLGRGPSKRGVGMSFGPDVTKRFLDDNGLKLLIRSHEVKEQGFEIEADGKLITVFSAPNYCDAMGNKGAYIIFEEDMNPQIHSFVHVRHPNIKPMHYAGNMFSI